MRMHNSHTAAMIIAIIALIAATVLMFNHVDGWGWLLIIAFLCVMTMSTEQGRIQ